MKRFGITFSKEGSALGFDSEVFPGIKGYALMKKDGIYIPAVHADKPGNGDFSKFLKALERTGRRIVFSSVYSHKLFTILAAKGYSSFLMRDKYGETFCMERMPTYPKCKECGGTLLIGIKRSTKEYAGRLLCEKCCMLYGGK